MDDGPAKNPVTCPECGAPTIGGVTCWEQLGAIIAWEYADPELLAEHFLTVAAYNLQHPAQFTADALEGLRSAFIDRLDMNVSVETLRRRAARMYNGPQRVLRDEASRQPVLRLWKMTIADVYLSNQPQGGAKRVRVWAACIRSEL